MGLYQIESGDMDDLIERGAADEPIETETGELTYIEIFRFVRPLGEDNWTGPHYPRPLLDQVLAIHEIVPEIMDIDDEVKQESSSDHLDVDALEEEERNEHSVNTRLNKFED